MSNALTKTEAANAELIRLDPKKFGPIVADYVDNRAIEKEANAEAKAAEKMRKAAQGMLLKEIMPARAAVCGNRVLTVKEGSTSEAAITLKNGRRVLLSDVTYFMVGREKIGVDEIGTLYGGREVGPSIEVA